MMNAVLDSDNLSYPNPLRRASTPEVSEQILKIVRELAVNALRHGHAHSIRIVGEMTDGTLHFSVSDDGCGFDVAAVPGPRDGHFGLQGIRERLRKYGGTMTIDATASGTRVAVSMPHVLEREEGT